MVGDTVKNENDMISIDITDILKVSIWNRYDIGTTPITPTHNFNKLKTYYSLSSYYSYLFRNRYISMCLGFNELFLAETNSPAMLKSLSEGTEVARGQRYLRASLLSVDKYGHCRGGRTRSSHCLHRKPQNKQC